MPSVVFGVRLLGADSDLIGGGSAVAQSSEGIFVNHSLGGNLPGPGLGDVSAGSILLERRSHRVEFREIQRFQAIVRACRRCQGRIQVSRRA